MTLQAEAVATGDGSTVLFTVPFSYILKSHVHVYLNEAETFNYTWPSDTTIQLPTAPVAGVAVTRKRQTPRAPLLSIAAGSLNPQDLNTLILQALFVAQEVEDQTFRSARIPGATPMVPAPFSQYAARANKILRVSSNGAGLDMSLDGGAIEAAVNAYNANQVSPVLPTAGYFAATVAIAKAQFGPLVTIPHGTPMLISGYSHVDDQYGGTFFHDNTDSTTTYPVDALGIVDNQGRRWKRSFAGPINLFWFARGDGSEESTGIQAFFTALINDREGYIPVPPVQFSHAVTIAIAGRITVKGASWLGAHLIYTGAGNACNWTGAGFSVMDNFYWTWGDSAVDGGLHITGAREGFYMRNMVLENPGVTPTVNAYALRLSSSWGGRIEGGRYRANRGIWADTTNTFDAEPTVVNAFVLSRVACQICTTGVDWQSGGGVSIQDRSAIEGNVTGIAIACGIGASLYVKVFGIFGNYLEGNTTDIVVGASNTSSIAPAHGHIWGNRLASGTHIIDLTVCDLVTVGENEYGAGDCIIRSGTSRINWDSEQGTTDTGPSTRYFRNGDLSINSVTVGRVYASKVIAPPQITANQNNYNPTGLSTAGLMRLTSDASRNITGIVPGGSNFEINILNEGAHDIVFENSSAGSSAANRFNLGIDRTVAAGTLFKLYYSAGLSRWVAGN